MSIFLQIGLGLLPGTITAVFLLIKRRAFQMKKILLVLLLTAGCGTFLAGGISDYVKAGAGKAGLSQGKMIAFANELAAEGAYEEAREVIGQYSESYGYDEECRLLNARIALLEGDYETAAHLYRYLCENTELISGDADEVEFAEAKLQNDASDLAMISYLQDRGEDITEYGYTETSYEEIRDVLEKDGGSIRRKIKMAVEEQYPVSDEASDCAKAVAEISEGYSELLESDGDTSSGRYKRAFDKVEEEAGEYLSLECVDKARIKADILAGDYEAVTENLREGSSYHELMIGAELYMSGLVSKSDFSDGYQPVSRGEAEAVKEQLNDIYQDGRDGLSVQEQKALKARVSAVSSQLDDPALMTLKEQLTAAAEGEAGTDKTKVYLELAKIENYFGNEASSDACLSTAIYTSQDCEDDSYVDGMSRIITVINNDEDNDTENIKNVSEYVDQVLDHSLTIDVESILSPQNQENAAGGADPGAYGSAEETDFAQAAVDYVSRVKSAISIGKIDTSEFEKITARVQIDSDYLTELDELKAALRIYDCGAQIQDFTLRKIDYTGSNIILVCDVSGSMAGSIQDLRDAVITFITDKNENESLSVVTFSNSIVERKAFGTPDESLIAFAEGMSANGGTDMFSAVVSCLNDFTPAADENNVLILMTDGQDNSPKYADEIYAQIGGLAEEKGVTVYTMGLGTEVDTAYLDTIAGSGNGEFIYVSDSASLESFYNMLHAQVYNQYEISYEAQDTLTLSGRTLEVTLPSENLRDVKTYSLAGWEQEEAGLQVSQNMSISGFSPRYIYKGLQDTEVQLKGRGFTAGSRVTVKLNGNIDYTVEARYTDSETYTVTIPSGIAVDTYDVEITVDGRRKVLQDGFSVVVQGDEKKTVFGPYVFTSAEKVENGEGNYTLKGSVTLNGWLHFKGDVALQGDLEEGGSIRVSDYSGSYVDYNEATAEGFGKVFAEKGLSLDLPALYEFTLYNDQEHLYDYTNYMVDDISTGVLAMYDLLRLDSPVVRLYPDSIGLYYSTGTTILPYQEKILNACGNTADLFRFTCDGSAQITHKNVGVVLDVSYGDPSGVYGHKINLLNSPVYFNGSFDVKLNTLKNEYTIGAMVNMAFFARESGLGAEISWKDHLIPDSVKLQLKLAQAVKLPTTFPIEVNNFTFTVSDINTAVENGTWTSLMFTGSADFSSMKVKDYIPQLGKFLGDLSLLEMPETSASIRVSPFTLEAEARLMLLSEIELAHAGVKLGTFDYTNTLLQLDNENVSGLSARLKTGRLTWDSADGRIYVELSGTGELDAHSRFVGVVYEGTAAYDISWWLINTESRQSGTVALGLYTTHEGKNEFIFRYRFQDSDGKVKGSFYYIDEDGKCGKENGVLS